MNQRLHTCMVVITNIHRNELVSPLHLKIFKMKGGLTTIFHFYVSPLQKILESEKSEK